LTKRVELLRRKLAEKDAEAMLVTQPENRRYLSGFTGSTGFLLVGLEKLFLLTDFRYLEQATQECPGWFVYEVKSSAFEALAELSLQLNISGLAFEDEHLTYKQFSELREKLPGKVKVLPSSGLVEELRMVKETPEIENLSKAVELADRAFKHILDFIRPGVKERDIAFELEFFMRRQGAAKISFDTIVASGPRGAMPHGVASEKAFEYGELVTFDFGCEYEDYFSDLTRTVSLGPPDREQEKIYAIVLEAQEAGLSYLKAGVKASEVDGVVREVISKHGYLEYFRHSTGHGVGLNVHEAPRLSRNDSTLLQPGMVVTVEPGIYIPGWGGVRIEDMAVVQEQGCSRLTQAPKDRLIVCSG
jgi:Xaa-Pro aminopeptidase